MSLDFYKKQVPEIIVRGGHAYKLIEAEINTNPLARPNTIGTLDVTYEFNKYNTFATWLAVYESGMVDISNLIAEKTEDNQKAYY